jgi:hypothetical protein
MKDSAELLRLYATTGSETTFKDLVDQYLPLVYSAALRQTNGDRELAKDVAQAVFIDLARKANKLVDRELLIGGCTEALTLPPEMPCEPTSGGACASKTQALCENLLPTGH